MNILQTERLLIRQMTQDDAKFILELLNSPKWIQFIGDRNIHTLEEAVEYIHTRVQPNYEALGFGFYLVERIADQVKIGNCGLTKRDGMEHADIGYSLLEKYEGNGYAYEATQAILKYGFEVHQLKHIEAITTPDNQSSLKLLNKLGLRYKRKTTLPGDEAELLLFGVDAPQKENINETY